MVEVKCKCGKSKRNFKVDVGSFVDECCIEAGYDELGNLKKKPLDTKDLPTEEELAAAAAKLQDDPNEEKAKLEDQKEEKEEESSDSENSTEERTETKEEKKARKKAEKAAAMAAQRKAEKETKADDKAE